MTDSAKSRRICLEDVSVGDTFLSGEHTVDVQQIMDFARQFDPQPFHLDEAAARHSFFGGLVASGWHTASLTMKLLVSSIPVAGGLIGIGGELTWPRATRPGDVLHVKSTVIGIAPSKSRPDRGIVCVQSDTLNQHEELCQRMVAKLLVFRRGAPNP